MTLVLVLEVFAARPPLVHAALGGQRLLVREELLELLTAGEVALRLRLDGPDGLGVASFLLGQCNRTTTAGGARSIGSTAALARLVTTTARHGLMKGGGNIGKGNLK